MSAKRESIGVQVPQILLPSADVDMAKWACVACDQYTSQEDYWEAVESIVGEAPSTLRLMLPEIFLNREGLEGRIEAIRTQMNRYLQEGILVDKGEGLIYMERSASGRKRRGLILALDLERYDYRKGSTTLIRATEGTIIERIPPRLRVRRGAPVEMPHIIILIDDPKRTVIEPLAEQTAAMEPLYDFDMMQQGGHLQGWMLQDVAAVETVFDALEHLADFENNEHPLLFALGDGNHSFATAKAGWEEIKAGLTDEEKEDHPARYCLVEIENVHDEGIVFEPIHRVLFNVDPVEVLEWLEKDLAKRNGDCRRLATVEMEAGTHAIPYVTATERGVLVVTEPAAQLAAGTLQNSLDDYLKSHPEAEIDYVHGDDVVESLGQGTGAAGFFLPAMVKGELFTTVIHDGALPRKTFSMGEANEKRFYVECRKIVK